MNRLFPIIGGPAVPWTVVAPYEAQAIRNHDQTLEQLASRGGLSPCELWCITHSKRLSERPSSDEASAWLTSQVDLSAQLETSQRLVEKLQLDLAYMTQAVLDARDQLAYMTQAVLDARDQRERLRSSGHVYCVSSTAEAIADWLEHQEPGYAQVVQGLTYAIRKGRWKKND